MKFESGGFTPGCFALLRCQRCRGHGVELRHEPREVDGPQRIVSLAPAITETLFALGAGAEVVGVSQYCDYPPEVARLPRVGTFLTPNIEAIAGRRPTIVIGLQTSSDLREIRALRAMGYRTLMVDDNSIAGIEASIRTVGDAIGRPRAGTGAAGSNAPEYRGD